MTEQTLMPSTCHPYSTGWTLSFGRLTAVAAFAFALFAGTPPTTAQPKPRQEVMVELHGSATLGNKMALGLATAWAKQLKLPGIRIDAGANPDEYEVIAEGAESTHRMRVKVQAKGHGFGLEPLLRGEIDFWMAARPVREADLDVMRKKGVPNVPTEAQMTAPGNENVVALSALTVIVNAKNPVPALSYQQLRDMYAGRVTS